jgi:hypothetical protein
MANRSDFNHLRSTLHHLTLKQAKQLYAELGVLIENLEHPPPTEPTEAKGREVVEARHLGNRLYQLERVRCGKVGCKCAGEQGQLHGPYWYAYWRDEGKLRSRYVGKQLRQIE